MCIFERATKKQKKLLMVGVRSFLEILKKLSKKINVIDRTKKLIFILIKYYSVFIAHFKSSVLG